MQVAYHFCINTEMVLLIILGGYANSAGKRWFCGRGILRIRGSCSSEAASAASARLEAAVLWLAAAAAEPCVRRALSQALAGSRRQRAPWLGAAGGGWSWSHCHTGTRMREVKVIAATPSTERGCSGGNTTSSHLSSRGQAQPKQIVGNVLPAPPRGAGSGPGKAAKGCEDTAAFPQPGRGETFLCRDRSAERVRESHGIVKQLSPNCSLYAFCYAKHCTSEGC